MTDQACRTATAMVQQHTKLVAAAWMSHPTVLGNWTKTGGLLPQFGWSYATTAK